MIPVQLLLDATGGAVIQRGTVEQFTLFASDAREVEGGELFVAVRGVHADGHDFAAEAIAQGATGVLLEATRVGGPASPLLADLAGTNAVIIVVPDVRLALRQYAAAVLRAWQPRVIAVAGSAGKTTTKEAIATILSQHASVFRSWRNYNDLLGVPLALGRLEPHHEFAVLELACDYLGELQALAEMIQPEIAVILNAYATHLDGLGSEQGVADALATLPAAMHAGQRMILNPADPHLRQVGDALAQRDDAPEVLWLGRDLPAAFAEGSGAQHLPHHDYLTLPLSDHAGTIHRCDFPHLHGGHWADVVLAALAVAQLVGIDPLLAAHSLADFAPLPGRMRLLDGLNGMRLLDDSHNAIPAAMRAALETLRRMHTGPKQPTHIAVLGDMLNLGNAERHWHATIGQLTPQFCDWLVTRGERAESIAQAAKAAGMPAERVIVTHTAQDAANAVLTIAAQCPTPPTVLIKGSPAMRMEQVTELLLSDPTTAPDVLDRQRSIWRRAVVAELNRPTWLEIDLGAIGQNARRITEIVGPAVALMATLKADAYGHGALKVARTVLRNGATWLGLATVSEAAILRSAGITAPMLVYGYVPPWQAREAVKLDLRATVYALDTAQALSRAAVALNKTAYVHLKVDSGMARLGLRAEDPAGIVAFVRDLHALPGIAVEGVYTHFATADEADQSYAREQLRRFQAVLAALTAANLRPLLTHAANSAATLALPEARFDIVRPGIALFGMDPSEEVPLPAGFRPALTFKTQIAQVKTVPAGEGISYGARYVTTAPERIAILPVGYADGFRRGPANWGEVLVRGQRAPIRGRVCMDQTIVSVEHIPDARAGDEVVLIGSQGDDAITAEEVAARLGTSNYEVVAALLARVPRVTG